MNKQPVELSEIKTEILHASISLDNETNDKSKKDSNVRMLKARRAIEAYQEEKLLHDSISNGWDALEWSRAVNNTLVCIVGFHKKCHHFNGITRLLNYDFYTWHVCTLLFGIFPAMTFASDTEPHRVKCCCFIKPLLFFYIIK